MLVTPAESCFHIPSSARWKKLVEGAVRLAFRSSGGDFEAPTRESLMAAVEKLAAKAAGMGTPADVIEYHRGQLAKVFAALS